MDQVLPFPSKKPEQEIIYFELMHQESGSRILINSFCGNEKTETELIVFHNGINQSYDFLRINHQQ